MSAPAATAPRTGRPARTGPALALLCAAPLLVITNYATPLILGPQTFAALDAGPVGQTWILTAISLGLAAMLLASGSLADNLGRRRVLIAGSWLFAASTLAAALAWGEAVFVAARIVQGAASAAMLTASLGIIGVVFPDGAARRAATARYGAMMGGGVGAGVVFAAALEPVLGWNGPYWLYAAAAIGLALASRAVLPESHADHPRRADLPGTALLAVGLAALMAGLTLGKQGWADPPVVALLVASAVLTAVFVAVERRTREPMLDLDLFARPAFLIASLGALVLGAAVIAMMSYVPTVLQLSGMGAGTTTVVFVIWSGSAFVVSLAVKRLPISSVALLVAALVVAGAGGALLYGAADQWSWWRGAIALLVAGAGYGAANSALTRLSIDSVPPDRGGMGSGVNNTMRYIGTASGIPAAAAIVDGSGLDGALWTCAAVAVAAAAAFALISRRSRTAGSAA